MIALLAAALLAAPVPPTPAPPASDTLDVFRLDSIAPGVWAATVIPFPDAYAFANSLVVIGDDAVLVVDAQASPTASAVLVDLVRGLSDLPVRWVVNTHWHGDHVAGNQAWADAFADVRFVGHPATVAAMATEGRAMREQEILDLPGSIAERRGWLESGEGPGGEPLTPEQRERVEYSVRLREAYLEELRTLRPIAPSTLVEERLELDLGGRTAEVLHPGPAHTAGDLVVHLPDAGVLAAGDLLEEAAPWLEGADVPGWAAALGRLQALDPAVVLPAHGGVQRDRRLLDGEAALFRDLVEAGRRAVAEGWSDDEAAERITLDAHRGFLATVGVEGEAFETFRLGAIREVLGDLRAEAGGDPAGGPEGAIAPGSAPQ
jgi:glyoxylase-like metal-dependent hydrolase (beta-lactamase superfamily II)